MRRSILLSGVIGVCILTFGLWTFSTLIALIFETGELDIVTAEELESNYGNLTDDKQGFLSSHPPVIPKIIHQTYKNTSVPEPWIEPSSKCKEMHPDYEYMLWTDESAREFIADHYPLFLPTYDGYPYTIQRADVIRYFILNHYGGIYIDMDLVSVLFPPISFPLTQTSQGCMRPLDALNHYPLWLHLTNPTGISNDAMGSAPGHPFWAQSVLPSLPSHAYRFPLPYVTVMASTGPLFLSALWKRWIDSPLNEGEGRIRVVHREEFSGAVGIFKIFKGSSWHGGDVRILRWMLGHAMLVGALITLAAVIVGCTAWKQCLRCRNQRRLKRWRDGKAYELVDRHEV
ncbi:MAG: hypothetical protein MMC23_000221 [Stictis urceolatum]|nr:hypothetical protein [Stictis urceolata]